MDLFVIYQRIIAALTWRGGAAVRRPATDELKFILLTKNHGEFAEKLRDLGQNQAANVVVANAKYVGLRWFQLGLGHLEDATAAAKSKSDRATYSRAYYAAYNVSKCVRYLVDGAVSLKGDDHARASELPDDFPQVEKWARDVTTLYEHRLLADYDNWQNTEGRKSLTPDEALDLARRFVDTAEQYLQQKFGLG